MTSFFSFFNWMGHFFPFSYVISYYTFNMCCHFYIHTYTYTICMKWECMRRLKEKFFFHRPAIVVRMRADTSTSQTLSLWMNKWMRKKGRIWQTHSQILQVPFGIFADTNNVFAMSNCEIERNMNTTERAIFIFIYARCFLLQFNWCLCVRGSFLFFWMKANATCCAKAHSKTNTAIISAFAKTKRTSVSVKIIDTISVFQISSTFGSLSNETQSHFMWFSLANESWRYEWKISFEFLLMLS